MGLFREMEYCHKEQERKPMGGGEICTNIG